MNQIEALTALKEGKKIKRKTWEFIKYVYLDKDGVIRSEDNEEYNGYFSLGKAFADDWEIVEETILDKQEKNYLENLLRPYTKRYDKILIEKTVADSNRFYISITFYAFKADADCADYVNLPYFDKDEHMYEKMEAEKFYTLDELGLFK